MFLRRFVIVSACALFIASNALAEDRPARDIIVGGMEQYAVSIRTMNADASAALFTDDGELGTVGQEPVRGREAIRAFLKSFANVKVLGDTITVLSVDQHGSSALVKATYVQDAQVTGQPPVHVTGRLEATWISSDGGHWLIRRMIAFPAT